MSDRTIMVIQLLRPLLYSYSVYSCYLFLISSASVKAIQFLSFIVPIFAWNDPLVPLTYLKRSLIFHIPLISLFLCIVHLRRPSYLPYLISGILHSVEYIFLSLSPLAFTSLLFSTIYKASSDNHFAIWHVLFFGIVFITASCTMLHTSIHSSSGTLYIIYTPLNLFITSTV